MRLEEKFHPELGGPLHRAGRNLGPDNRTDSGVRGGGNRRGGILLIEERAALRPEIELDRVVVAVVSTPFVSCSLNRFHFMLTILTEETVSR
jgi:hypothetical protein